MFWSFQCHPVVLIVINQGLEVKSSEVTGLPTGNKICHACCCLYTAVETKSSENNVQNLPLERIHFLKLLTWLKSCFQYMDIKQTNIGSNNVALRFVQKVGCFRKFQKILIVLNISHRIQQRATTLVEKVQMQFILWAHSIHQQAEITSWYWLIADQLVSRV